MDEMADDRVYDADTEATEVFVAAGMGVVAVSVSAGRVGRFGVERRCTPRDIAGGEGVVAVATDEDVLVRDGGAFSPSGFGPAVAVGVHGGSPVAADADGRIARHEEDWTAVGTLEATVAAIDGPLLATDEGVYRIGGDGGEWTIRSAGLESAHDVAAGGPFAATDAGLYALGNGWRREIEGRCHAVAASARDRAHAAGEAFYERRDGGWLAIDAPPAEPVADVAEGERAYAVTQAGTLLVGPEWRSRSIGVSDVVGIAVA